MVAPVVLAAIPTLLEIGGKLIERLFPDPEDQAQAKLKLFELQQTGQLAELDAWVKTMQADAEDRASARLRETQTGDSATPRTLAAIFTAGFFMVLGWLLVSGPPEHGSEALLVLLGALSAGQAAILSYYFGSSSSSRTKNETIQTLVEPRR
jgi:hypothetical protein